MLIKDNEVKSTYVEYDRRVEAFGETMDQNNMSRTQIYVDPVKIVPVKSSLGVLQSL